MGQSVKNPMIIVLAILFTCMSIGAPTPVMGVERQVYTPTTLDEEDEFDTNSSHGQPDRFDNEVEFNGKDSGLDEAENEFDAQDNAYASEEKTSASNFFIGALSSLNDDGIFTLSQEVACHTDDASRISLNRTSLRLRWEHLFASQYFMRFDGKAAYNASYDYLDYPNRTRDHYRFFTRVRELYLQAGSENTGFTLGQQIIVWGEADGAVVTDIISPRDFTESVFTRIEDARLGQMIIKADRYADWGQWTLLINLDPQVNIYAEPGHEYAGSSMADTLGSDTIGIQVWSEDKPSHSIEDTELGGRWKKTFGKSDISLMAATTLYNSPVFESQGVDLQGSVILRPVYPRYTMIGTAANRAKGNFLFKGELAYKSGRRFNHTNQLAQNGLVERDVIDVAFGLDYDANGAWQAAFEISDQNILNWQSGLYLVRRHETGMYFNWSKDFSNQTINIQYTWFYQIQDTDSMHRLESEYDINDHWKFKFGVTLFDIRDQTSRLGVFKDRHRIAVQVEVSF